jgi:hypothetical protein
MNKNRFLTPPFKLLEIKKIAKPIPRNISHKHSRPMDQANRFWIQTNNISDLFFTLRL